MNTKNIIFKSILGIVIVSVVTVFATVELLRAGTSEAQVLSLPDATSLLPVSSGFSPSVLKGVRFNYENPLQLEFLIDQQDSQVVTEKTAQRLVHYFLAALTVPEGDMWVNLSPYEEDRIVPKSLGETDLGKDLLAQDYLLKQLSSSLTHPDTELGKDYWQDILGDDALAQVASNEFNKVWIMPHKADLVEYKSSAYVKEASLKVMTEQDYLAKKINNSELAQDATSKTIKEKIIPALEKDINDGENFSRLRQIYHSLILASWFKTKYQKSVFKYYIDKNKIEGIDIADKAIKKKIWSLYCDSFNKGVYNAVRPYEYNQKKVKRVFFSGGITGEDLSSTITVLKTTDIGDVPLPESDKGYRYLGKADSNSSSVNHFLGEEIRLSNTIDDQVLKLKLNENKKFYELYIGDERIEGSEFIFTEDENRVFVNKIVIGYTDDKYKGLGIGKDVFEKVMDYAVDQNKDIELKVTSNLAVLNMAKKYAGDSVEYVPTVFDDAYRGNSLKELLIDAETLEIEIQGVDPAILTYRYSQELGLIHDIQDDSPGYAKYDVSMDKDFRVKVVDRSDIARRVVFDVNVEENLYNVVMPFEALIEYKQGASSTMGEVGGIDLNKLMVDTDVEAFDKVFVPFNLRTFDGFEFVPIELKKLDNPQSFVPLL